MTLKGCAERDARIAKRQGKPDRMAPAREALKLARQARREATMAVPASPPPRLATIPQPAEQVDWREVCRLEREKRAPIIAQREADALAEVRAIIQRADERQAVHNRGGRPRRAKS